MSDLRIKAGDVTDALIRATEKAADMGATDVLVILYRKTPEESSEPCRVAIVDNEEMTFSQANWLIDKVKMFLLQE